MNEIFIFFRVIVFFVIFTIFLTSFKRAKFNTLPKSKPAVHAPKTTDFVKSYSSKNKECFEHEIKTSSVADHPKRKKSLWNEPSWDDELYEKK